MMLQKNDLQVYYMYCVQVVWKEKLSMNIESIAGQELNLRSLSGHVLYHTVI